MHILMICMELESESNKMLTFGKLHITKIHPNKQIFFYTDTQKNLNAYYPLNNTKYFIAYKRRLTFFLLRKLSLV